MTTGKTIALTRRTFVGKVISLLFNMRETKTQIISIKDLQEKQNLFFQKESWKDSSILAIRKKEKELMTDECKNWG